MELAKQVTAELEQTMFTPEEADAPVIPIPPPPAASSLTFPTLMQRITAAYAEKRISQADISQAVQAAGIPSLPMLASRPDLVASVAVSLGLQS